MVKSSIKRSAPVASSKYVPDVSSGKGAKVEKSSTGPRRQPTSKMVVNAVTALQEKKGSSLVAIKKYIAQTYQVDTERLGHFIRKALKSSVEKNVLVQSSGSGANGKFRLATANPTTKKSAINAEGAVNPTALEEFTAPKPKEVIRKHKLAATKAVVQKIAKNSTDIGAKKRVKLPGSKKTKIGGKSPVAAKTPRTKRIIH